VWFLFLQTMYDPRKVKLREFCGLPTVASASSADIAARAAAWSGRRGGSQDGSGEGGSGSEGGSSSSEGAFLGAVVVPEAEQEALALCAHGAMSMFARSIEADAAPKVQNKAPCTTTISRPHTLNMLSCREGKERVTLSSSSLVVLCVCLSCMFL
jgi:hypothetical protein